MIIFEALIQYSSSITDIVIIDDELRESLTTLKASMNELYSPEYWKKWNKYRQNGKFVVDVNAPDEASGEATSNEAKPAGPIRLSKPHKSLGYVPPSTIPSTIISNIRSESTTIECELKSTDFRKAQEHAQRSTGITMSTSTRKDWHNLVHPKNEGHPGGPGFYDHSNLLLGKPQPVAKNVPSFEFSRSSRQSKILDASPGKFTPIFITELVFSVRLRMDTSHKHEY